MSSDIAGILIYLLAQISLGAAVLAVHAVAAGRMGKLSPRGDQAVTGAVFGLAGSLAAIFPVQLAPGLPASTVTASVGLAGLFGGWIGGAVAVAFSAVARILLDYPHPAVGTARGVTAALLGIAVAAWIHRKGGSLRARHLLMLGLLVLVLTVAIQPLVTGWPKSVVGSILPLAIVLPLSTVLLGFQFLTEQRRADLSQRLAANEHRLRRLIENMPGAVIEMHRKPDGWPEYTFWRNGQLQLGEIGPQIEANPALLHELLLPEEAELRGQFLRASAADMKTGVLEYRIELPDGKQTWLRTRATPRQEADGRVVWTGMVTDITAEKRKDAELRRFTAELGESGQRFRTVMANLPAMIFEARESPDGSYAYTFVSDGVRMLGISPQELLDDPKRMEALYFPEDEPARLHMLKEARDTMSLREREFRVKLADGTVRWLQTRAQPHRGRGGVIIWDGVIFDITERKRLQEAPHRSEQMLTLGGLTEGVAQAFNLLLQEVGLAAGALVPQVQDRADLMAPLERIRMLVDRGSNLEEDLIRFTRTQAEGTGPVNLKVLLEGVRDLAGNLVGRDTRFSVRASPALWPAMADATRLQSAVLGLVLHARDVLPRGGEITLTARNVMLSEADGQAIQCPAGAYVRIVVADSGAVTGGESPAFAAGENSGGAGERSEIDLRLCAVQDFAVRSGGHFAERSMPGKETVLQLLLPAIGPAETALPQSPFRLA